MLLALRSLWEGAPVLPGSTVLANTNIDTPPTLVTGSVFPMYADLNQTIMLSLFTQDPQTSFIAASPNDSPGIDPIDLATPPVVRVVYPNKTFANFPYGGTNFTVGSLPAVTHTANTGAYFLRIAGSQTGLYTYQWYTGSVSIFSGSFYVRGTQ